MRNFTERNYLGCINKIVCFMAYVEFGGGTEQGGTKKFEVIALEGARKVLYIKTLWCTVLREIG